MVMMVLSVLCCHDGGEYLTGDLPVSLVPPFLGCASWHIFARGFGGWPMVAALGSS